MERIEFQVFREGGHILGEKEMREKNNEGLNVLGERNISSKNGMKNVRFLGPKSWRVDKYTPRSRREVKKLSKAIGRSLEVQRGDESENKRG